MAETFFITTAIDYTNAPPHIGHAYEKVLADVIARWHREREAVVLGGCLGTVRQHGIAAVAHQQVRGESLELAFLGGLTHTEVAERLDIPLGTAKTRIRDALRSLRTELEGDL